MTLFVAISCDPKTPEPRQFTVTFDKNVLADATEQPTNIPAQITVKENQTVTKPANPSRTGYTFDGWYMEPGCTTVYEFTGQVTKDITLYAKWKINHVTVKFLSPVDESELSVDKDGDFGTDLTLDIASETGKDFLGWYDNKDCIGTPVPLSTTFPAQDTTYYAKLVDSTEIENSFEFTDGNATVSVYKGSDTDVVIPYTHNGTQITKIANDAFKNNITVAKVFIPEGITSIPQMTFSGCSNLTSVTIPEGVTSIGNQAFGNCSKLESIKLPSSLKQIAVYAFMNSGLTEVTIPAYVNSIGDGVFRGCKKLTSIDVEQGNAKYKSVDGALYENGTTLAQVPAGKTTYTFPSGVETIKAYAFAGCDKLEETIIEIPDSVTKIGVDAFTDATFLKEITLPSTLITIENYVFANCSNLTNVTIPASVTSIGTYAFLGCKGLTTITIPDSVTSIASNTFNNCTNLTEIIIDETKLDAASKAAKPWGAVNATNIHAPTP